LEGEPVDSSTAGPGHLVGTSLGDLLTLVRYIDHGWAGDVYEGRLRRPYRDLLPGDAVAVKLYRPAVLQKEEHIDRLRQEAEFAVSQDHPNLLRVYGLEWSTSAGHDQPYLIMELLTGETLATRNTRCGPSRIGSVRSLADQLLAAIEQLHPSHIHRDIKPENIMILSGDHLKLMDFGVLKVVGAPTITNTGEFLGTIRYAAPKYLFGADYDHRVDLYSAGVVLFELVYGRPFIEQSLPWAEQVYRVRNEGLPIDLTTAEDLDEFVFLQAIHLLSQKDPAKRLRSAAEARAMIAQGEAAKVWRQYFSWLYEGDTERLRTLALSDVKADRQTAFRELLIAARADGPYAVSQAGNWLIAAAYVRNDYKMWLWANDLLDELRSEVKSEWDNDLEMLSRMSRVIRESLPPRWKP
jgi:serine/threonine protein kinase